MPIRLLESEVLKPVASVRETMLWCVASSPAIVTVS